MGNDRFTGASRDAGRGRNCGPAFGAAVGAGAEVVAAGETVAVALAPLSAASAMECERRSDQEEQREGPVGDGERGHATGRHADGADVGVSKAEEVMGAQRGVVHEGDAGVVGVVLPLAPSEQGGADGYGVIAHAFEDGSPAVRRQRGLPTGLGVDEHVGAPVAAGPGGQRRGEEQKGECDDEVGDAAFHVV